MTVINKAIKILLPFAQKHPVEDNSFYITQGIDINNLQEVGEEYCSDCIDDKVNEYHENFFIKRNFELSKIYQIQNKGFFFTTVPVWKDGKHIGVKTKKIKSKQVITKKLIRDNLRRINKEFHPDTKFSYGYFDTRSCNGVSFRSCDCCGKLFNYPFLLEEDELQYWEDNLRKKSISNPSCAYSLLQIFQYWDMDKNFIFYDRIFALAKKVIEFSSVKIILTTTNV